VVVKSFLGLGIGVVLGLGVLGAVIEVIVRVVLGPGVLGLVVGVVVRLVLGLGVFELCVLGLWVVVEVVGIVSFNKVSGLCVN
jgi:hypothetical protein